MRDTISPILKVVPALKLSFLVFFLITSTSSAQNEISAEEYEVINTLFDGKTNIYKVTLFDKGWAHYFEDLEKIINRVGIPTTISDEALKEKLDKNTLRQIHSAILRLKPYKLEKGKLNESIELKKTFDNDKAIENEVFRISKPILVDNKIAVVKKVSELESPVFILQKHETQWRIVYTFYDWYILY